ncbi:hypothetical protein [Microbacterium sp. RU33B]|uniref:hypothetical protein n=1 Tax=Microbacterium sp. RU33B TaxID=1907390 RepID=UPI0009591C38|nr:hypothetical protein [Microbacterium sp. RU33B]SIT86328.1 hypothetical protein SAMN05880545_2502 [Microbacterium sp. RU33B]
MDFPRSGRFVFVVQWILALLLPVWIFLGRELVGAQVGWMAVIGIVYGAFVILFLLIPPLVSLFDRDVRRRRSERVAYSIAMGVAWIALFLAGLVIPDSGDSGRLDTALTVWTGGLIGYEATETIFIVLVMIVFFALVAGLALAIIGAGRAGRASAGSK